jgi:hypothetical protein
VNVFHEFHNQGKFERSLNVIFIALIPKKVGAMDIKDFFGLSASWVAFVRLSLKF